MKTKIFLSYSSRNEEFVGRIFDHLRQQEGIDPFFYPHGPRPHNFNVTLAQQLNDSTSFVLFCGKDAGEIQVHEAAMWLETPAGEKGSHIAVVIARGASRFDLRFEKFMKSLARTISTEGTTDDHAIKCAEEICRATGTVWVDPVGLPTGFLFDYEKDIIQEYEKGEGSFSIGRIKLGCPAKWPSIRREHPGLGASPTNPIPPEIRGNFKTGRISVDVRLRSGMAPAFREEMVFPEAGPRESLLFSPAKHLHVGILVSGGLAPGINAAIHGIVTRHRQYADAHPPHVSAGVRIIGYQDGFKALTRDSARGPRDITVEEARRHATRGGSILPTAREDDLLESERKAERMALLVKAANRLATSAIDILYVVGGGGSMRAARALGHIYRRLYPRRPLMIIGVPKTMDNDILWVWQSFGFMSAVEGASDMIMQLHTEVTSNPRLCVVQLFGSDSGFVVSHAALGSGVCDLALIPEMQFTMGQVCDYITEILSQRYRSGPHGIVVMAETALPLDATDYLGDAQLGLSDNEVAEIRTFLANGRRVRGQTPDALRSGALKIVSGVLKARVREIKTNPEYWEDFRIFVNEPRHLIRSMPPSATEIAFANRLGTLAVDSAMAGYTDVMVSQWLTEFVLVPLELAVLGKKRVPLDGMFWKSVCTSTGQKGLGLPTTGTGLPPSLQ